MTDLMDEPMNFHAAAPKIPARILCIGMPVRDLTFRMGGWAKRAANPASRVLLVPPSAAARVSHSSASTKMVAEGSVTFSSAPAVGAGVGAAALSSRRRANRAAATKDPLAMAEEVGLPLRTGVAKEEYCGDQLCP